MGWMAWRSSSSFQPASCWLLQSPYARLIVGVPYLAISSSSSVARLAVVLSESMSTASLVVSVAVTGSSAAGELAVLFEPRDPLRRQGPGAIGQRHGVVLVGERL